MFKTDVVVGDFNYFALQMIPVGLENHIGLFIRLAKNNKIAAYRYRKT